jgi:hypothetical protein
MGLIDKAAQWGSDQELKECCDWLNDELVKGRIDEICPASLRAARRPKQPNLKELALAELGDVYDKDKIDDTTYDTIRRALEQLDD